MIDNTKKRILDTAIQLVAVQGVQNTSIREIAQASDSNVAAVNYHFGSKKGLMEQVLVSIYEPLNSKRVELLKRFESACHPEPVPVKDILEALLRPVVFSAKGKDGGSLYVRTQQHLSAQPGSESSRFVSSTYDSVAQYFIDALHRVLPEFTRAEIIWRYEFVRSAAIHLMLISDPNSGKLRTLTHGSGMIDLDDREAVLQELLAFSTYGFSAPPTWNDLQLKPLD